MKKWIIGIIIIGVILMALNFSGISSTLFPGTKASGEGFGADSSEELRNEVAGTKYYTVNPSAWLQQDESQIFVRAETSIEALQNTIRFYVPLSLPDGAVITGVVVYGNAAASAETWTLYRTSLSGAVKWTMATANIQTESTAISYSDINNELYAYVIETSTLDLNDALYGVRITYTE